MVVVVVVVVVVGRLWHQIGEKMLTVCGDVLQRGNSMRDVGQVF